MAQGLETTPDAALAALALSAADPSLTQRELAATLGLGKSTVTTLLRRYEPVAHELRTVKRDLFTGLWQYAALENIDALEQHKAKGTLTAGDRRNYIVAAAVASEKALLFAGQPTQIVAGMHEVRVALPDLLAKLAEVGARIRHFSTATPSSWPGGRSPSAGLSPTFSFASSWIITRRTLNPALNSPRR